MSNLIDCPTPIASAPISSTRQAKPRQPLSHLYDSPCQVRSSRATPTRLSAPCLVETCLIQPNRQASSVLVISRLTNTTSRIYTRLDLSTQHDCPLLVVTYHTSTTYQSNTTSLIRSCLITSDQHDYPAFIASYPIRTTTHFSSSRVKSTRQSKSRHTPSLLINTTSHIRPRQFTSHQHDYPYRPNPYLVRPTRHASSGPYSPNLIDLPDLVPSIPTSTTCLYVPRQAVSSQHDSPTRTTPARYLPHQYDRSYQHTSYQHDMPHQPLSCLPAPHLTSTTGRLSPPLILPTRQVMTAHVRSIRLTLPHLFTSHQHDYPCQAPSRPINTTRRTIHHDVHLIDYPVLIRSDPHNSTRRHNCRPNRRSCTHLILITVIRQGEQSNMGIFDNDVDLYTDYKVELAFRDKLLGATPKDPTIIEAWLRSKAGIEKKEELRRATLQTLLELGAEVRPDMPYDEIAEAAKHLAANKQTNGFKIDSDGLYIESRILKAMLKEVTNILFAGKRWGPTKKGPKSFLAERVFVSPSHVGLGIKEPSGIELFIGHTNGPQGRMSNLTYYEYAEQPVLQFTIRVAEDAVPLDAWPELWVLAQDNGLGALRSQGHGCFDVNCWERIES